jgi:mRNA-degrading endonuclease RelE of RelBE toxin-antitoxin system
MKIIITKPFGRKLKKLKKKYPNIKKDMSRLLSDMEEGSISGDAIPGLFSRVFKVRAASSDMKRGKSGGYRIVYYADDESREIYLLTVYAKTKAENIPLKDIQAVLRELDLNLKPPNSVHQDG